MKKQLLTLTLLATQGCVTPTICTQSGAYDNGRRSALAGMPADFDHGSVCEGDKAPIFRTNYQKGYDNGIQVLCSVQNASDDGRDAGLQGQSIAALPLRYNVCGTTRTQLEKPYMTAYREALNQFCSAETAQARGTQAGRANQGTSELDATYLNCPTTQRTKLKQVWQDAYIRGLRDYCDPNNHLETIRGLAKRSGQPSYDPQTFGSCAQQFPDLLNVYYNRFYQERQVVVDSLCTYENGLNSGRADADQMNMTRGGSPDFCDERTVRNYQRGYNRGWAEQKQIICTRDDFQEIGYQDGLRGQTFDPKLPEFCPSDYHRDMRERYRIGYERGRRSQHHDGVQPGTPGPSSDRVIQSCGEAFSFDSDKLACITAAKDIRHGASEVIQACTQTFSMTSDRLQCIRNNHSHYAADILRSCKQIMSFTSDIQSCTDRVKDTRYNPTRSIDACGQAFAMTSDRLECISAAVKYPGEASGRVNSCKQSFSFSSDILKCIRS